MSDRSAFEAWTTLARRDGFRTAALLAAAVPLLVLAVATLVVQQRTAAVRSELIEVVEPARALTSDIQYHLAREIALLRGFALTGSDRFLDMYSATYQRERELWPLLHSRTTALSPEVALTARKLEESVDAWRRTIDLDALRGQRTEPALSADPDLGGLRYDEAIRLAVELSDDLGEQQTVMLAAMQRMESAMAVFTYVVILIALVGTIAAAWLIVRIRAFAAESEALRLQASRHVDIRNRLLRGLSHDVKNPLSAASGYAELVRMRLADRLQGREREWVDRIHETIHAAATLLDDLVILSRADANELDVQPEPVDLRDLLDRVARSEEAAFQEADVTLELRLPERLPGVHTNARRVEQVLTNLLSNARKYTPPGGSATLSAEVHEGTGTGPHGRRVAIRVSDTGPGIPGDRHEAVFQEFTRLDPDRASGYGLGLAMSRSIARALGGGLSLESTPRHGSTFTLWLPLDRSAARDSEPHRGAESLSA